MKPGFNSGFSAIKICGLSLLVLYSALKEMFDTGCSAFTLSSKPRSDFICHDLIISFVLFSMCRATVLEYKSQRL